MESLYDIEYVIDDQNKQETGLTLEEVELREKELRQEQEADEIRIIAH